MADFEAMLEEAELPEKTVRVCLRGKLRGEWEQLSDEYNEARRRPRESLSDDGGQSIAQQMAELEEAMRAATVSVRMRALEDRRVFNKMLADHPPRKENRLDATLGLNKDTFFDALIPMSIVDVTAPDGDVHVPDDSWVQKMLTKITAKQFDDLASAAFTLNGGSVDIPFSPTASRTIRDSVQTSRRQSDSASASGAGKGGNRKRSPRSSTTKKAS